MYYVLFDTGNEAFFSRIADAFCSIVVKSIIDLYKNEVFSRPGSTILDQESIRVHLKKNEHPLLFLNCPLLFDIRCKNQECLTGHTAVLTSTQTEQFGLSMNNKMNSFLRATTQNARDRLNVQEVLHNYAIANISQLEVIRLENQSDHNEYLRLFVKKTDKLKNKHGVHSFMYVRAADASDYDYFKANTALPNVAVCDCFQYNFNN